VRAMGEPGVEGEVEVEVRVAGSASELADACAVRREVFQVEQRVDASREVDEHDASFDGPGVRHFVARAAGGEVVGAGRLMLAPSETGLASVGRVAVRQAFRGRGVGKRIMRAIEAEAMARGFQGVVLGAQSHAIPFYLSLGYVCTSDTFLDGGSANIPHRMMELRFTARPPAH